MDEKTRWRQRARTALEAYFHQRSFPRIILSLLVALTGGFGFLISFGLLHGGVRQMWLRYPLAVLGAYAFFLVLLRLWVGIERARFWREREDGTVGFSDGRTPVVSFELGDGVDYESYAPARPLLTLVAE